MKLNRKQQELYNRVVAADGHYVVETVLASRVGRKHTSAGYGDENAMASMLPEWQRSYVPGGFSRQPVLRLIYEEEIRRNDVLPRDVERPVGSVWSESIRRYTVRLATPEEIATNS